MSDNLKITIYRQSLIIQLVLERDMKNGLLLCQCPSEFSQYFTYFFYELLHIFGS